MENTEMNVQEATQTEERTFTQAELNAIVQKRLGEQAAKYGNYEELKEKGLGQVIADGEAYHHNMASGGGAA